jgi:L-amino acid N-acyltransferase YncA
MKNFFPGAGVNIRLARIDDLPAITTIYNQAVESRRSTADMEPVRVEDREAWFREHPPGTHPIFVAEVDGKTAGWCSLSAYRPGRAALRFTAEISYYVDEAHKRRGIATAFVRHSVAACADLQIKNLFAIVLEHNASSIRILEKAGFEKWGFLPRVADFEGEECGQYYYGIRIPEKE